MTTTPEPEVDVKGSKQTGKTSVAPSLNSRQKQQEQRQLRQLQALKKKEEEKDKSDGERGKGFATIEGESVLHSILFVIFLHSFILSSNYLIT